MKIDGEVSIICDMSKLENHLIQQKTEQQNYSQHDVTELKEFLTKQPNQTPAATPDTEYWDIRVLLENHTVNDVTLQTLAVFYINPEELVKQHHHILRMILQSLGSEDRMRLLHTKLRWDRPTLLHLIAVYEKTGETMKTVLELVSEDQPHHLLSSTQDNIRQTPLHWACWSGNSAVLEVMMRQVTPELTRYKLLQIPDSLGYTPLHYTAESNATEAIRIIADFVSSHHLIHLLTITDRLGLTPVQMAAVLRDNQEAEKLLQSLYTTAFIDLALQQTDETSK